MRAGGSAPGSHRPRLAPAPRSPPRVPVVACAGHATRMAALAVRVSTRSHRTGVEVNERGVLVRGDYEDPADYAAALARARGSQVLPAG